MEERVLVVAMSRGGLCGGRRVVIVSPQREEVTTPLWEGIEILVLPSGRVFARFGEVVLEVLLEGGLTAFHKGRKITAVWAKIVY